MDFLKQTILKFGVVEGILNAHRSSQLGKVWQALP